jgi:CDP-diacylglycerol--serine O-phosphatidyltransferase
MTNDRPRFIISLSWIDLITLASLLLACLGLLSALHGWLSLAIALMLLGMLTDMIDGALARSKFNPRGETEFGRYLDSFCDVFVYLVLPLFVLYQFGMQDVLSLVALFAFLASGVLRLSRYNIVGTIEDAGVKYHLGLQVIWSHLVLVLAFPIWHWWGDSARYLIAGVLLIMSLFMIRNLRFRKPTNYVPLTILILAVAAFYLYLHLVGIASP